MSSLINNTTLTNLFVGSKTPSKPFSRVPFSADSLNNSLITLKEKKEKYNNVVIAGTIADVFLIGETPIYDKIEAFRSMVNSDAMVFSKDDDQTIERNEKAYRRAGFFRRVGESGSGPSMGYVRFYLSARNREPSDYIQRKGGRFVFDTVKKFIKDGKKQRDDIQFKIQQKIDDYTEMVKKIKVVIETKMGEAKSTLKDNKKQFLGAIKKLKSLQIAYTEDMTNANENYAELDEEMKELEKTTTELIESERTNVAKQILDMTNLETELNATDLLVNSFLTLALEDEEEEALEVTIESVAPVRAMFGTTGEIKIIFSFDAGMQSRIKLGTAYTINYPDEFVTDKYMLDGTEERFDIRIDEIKRSARQGRFRFQIILGSNVEGVVKTTLEVAQKRELPIEKMVITLQEATKANTTVVTATQIETTTTAAKIGARPTLQSMCQEIKSKDNCANPPCLWDTTSKTCTDSPKESILNFMTTKNNSRLKLAKNIRFMAEELDGDESKNQFAHAVYFHLFDKECPENWKWKRVLDDIEGEASTIKTSNWSLGNITKLFLASGLGGAAAGELKNLKPDFDMLNSGNVQTFCSPNGTVINVTYPEFWNDSVEPVMDYCKTVNLNGTEYLKHPLVFELKLKDGLSESSRDNSFLRFTIPETGIVGILFKDFLFEPEFTMGDYKKISGTSYIKTALIAIQTYIQENPGFYIDPSARFGKYKITNITEMVTTQLKIAAENQQDEISQLNHENERIMREERQKREPRPEFVDLNQ